MASSSSARRPPPPGSRTDFVRDAIKEAILTGEFGPGETLVEAEVGALLGVSKTPVREALRILAGSGLVTMSTYKGAAVRVMDAEGASAVYDLRALLEPEAVRRAVERGAGFREARQVLAEVETGADAADRAKASLTNRLFHRALYSECGNPLLVEILDDLRDQAALITVTGWGISPTWQGEAAEHRAILAAAESGNARQTEHLLRRHIADFLDRVAFGLPGEPTTETKGAR
ncbi:GntR family transcriptional regulator [Amycolatopsis sp. OK19-0408]|uniref:GntR family transcriptional regulator n=1 Tax=Amycolatopsis iheyensis TaxID=2945988 RepID=A0A9X2N3G1_9PSEU|nr:GntR family transcriptional regulator [Amycolatopsis iheyensis]MCR6481229.1 GntR family transcriptional regulator [Amycolatopsis iheyensis]